MSASGIVPGVLVSALEGLAMREQVIAQNVANIATPGYQAQDVQFAATLQQAMATGNVDAQVVTEAGAMNQNGNGVDLEQQLSLLNQVAMVQQGVMNQVDADEQEAKAFLTDLGGAGV
jgi:flagellar basal-body rod protein FlgB